MHTQPLNNLQMEIIKLYSTNLNQKDLWELKQVLANHFAQKAIMEANEIWKEQKLSNKDMEKWLNEE